MHNRFILDLVGFEELLGEISEAGIPSNQVKGVMDRMNYLIKKNIWQPDDGYSSVNSGTSVMELVLPELLKKRNFKTNMIKIPRIIFSPGATFSKAP